MLLRAIGLTDQERQQDAKTVTVALDTRIRPSTAARFMMDRVKPEPARLPLSRSQQPD